MKTLSFFGTRFIGVHLTYSLTKNGDEIKF